MARRTHLVKMRATDDITIQYFTGGSSFNEGSHFRDWTTHYGATCLSKYGSTRWVTKQINMQEALKKLRCDSKESLRYVFSYLTNIVPQDMHPIIIDLDGMPHLDKRDHPVIRGLRFIPCDENFGDHPHHDWTGKSRWFDKQNVLVKEQW